MKTPTKPSSLWALCLIACGIALRWIPVAPAAENHSELDQALRTAIAHGAAPGAVVLAVDRGGVIYEGAFGVANVETGRAMSADAVFHIASMTKPITTVALLQLMEEGRISLDDRAGKYLPELDRAVVLESFDVATKEYHTRPPRGPITVRQLLTHTAGFAYPFTSATLRDFKPRNGKKLTTPLLMFEPGTQWLYGTGLDYVGRIIETISGITLDAYFQKKIFGPLGMSDTYYNLPPEKWGRIVPIHRREPDGTFILPTGATASPRTLVAFNGSGALRSTARDYGRFLRMILNGGTLEGVRILSRESVAAMGRNQIGPIGVRALVSAQPDRSRDLTFIADGRDKWGLGFLITSEVMPGRRDAGTLSWGGINNTYFWIDLERGIAGVVLMQFLPFADPRALELCNEFERGVYRLGPSNKR